MQSDSGNVSFALHLLHVFCNGSSLGVSLDLRQLAGLIIKNYILLNMTQMDEAVCQSMTAAMARSLSDESVPIRSTASSLCARLVAGFPIKIYANITSELLRVLSTCSDDVSLDGALQAVHRICEDCAEKLAIDGTLTSLAGLLLRLMKHPQPAIRLRSLESMNALLFLVAPSGGAGTPPMGSPLAPSKHITCTNNMTSNGGVSAVTPLLPQFLAQLGELTSDPVPGIRKTVCQSIALLCSFSLPLITPHFHSILQFLLTAASPQHLQGTYQGEMPALAELQQVAIEAIEVFIILAENDDGHDLLQHFKVLSSLVPLLISLLPLSKEQIEMERLEEEQYASGAAEVSLHHRSSNASSPDIADTAGGSMCSWTLRKQSAKAIDVLGVYFSDEILPIALPCIERGLQSSEVYQQEAQLLALGALSAGCQTKMKPYLPQLLPYFMRVVEFGEVPELRAIGCWVLGRYCHGWDPLSSFNDNSLSDALVVTLSLINAMKDVSPRVQTAACSALCAIIAYAADEDDGEDVSDEAANAAAVLHEVYLHPLFKSISICFEHYGVKNRLILCDLIGTCADALGDVVVLQKSPESLTELYMPHLTRLLLSADEASEHLFPIFECLTSIYSAAGGQRDAVSALHPYSANILGRSVQILSSQMQCHLHEEPNSASVHDIVVCALDSVGGIAEGCGAEYFLSLVQETRCGAAIVESVTASVCRATSSEVRQSGFALLGEIIKVCPQLIADRFPQFLQQITAQLSMQSPLVCNNAVWCGGLIMQPAKAANIDLSQQVAAFVESLAALLMQLQDTHYRVADEEHVQTVLQNVCIAFGRCLRVIPAAGAHVWPAVMEPFMRYLINYVSNMRSSNHSHRQLKSLPLGDERNDTFEGLLTLLQMDFNKVGALSSIVYNLCRLSALRRRCGY